MVRALSVQGLAVAAVAGLAFSLAAAFLRSTQRFRRRRLTLVPSCCPILIDAILKDYQVSRAKNYRVSISNGEPKVYHSAMRN